MTKVCITVDVECSIGGAFRNPTLIPVGDKAIWCTIQGRSEGLGFILETLKAQTIAGTFFLETNHTHYFKISPIGKAAQWIRSSGHDVQMHAHPCWSNFQYTDWRERCGEHRKLDNFIGLSVDDTVKIVEHGCAVFDDWRLSTPTIFRSGNLQHDDNLYRALSQCGIRTSSNIGLGVFNSGLPEYQLYSGHQVHHGVREFPVLTYEDRLRWGSPSLKCLTITGTSFSETCALLEQAELQNVPLVVILTHPSEFIQKNNGQYSIMRRHLINQRRLQKLTSFLRHNRGRFPCITMAEASGAFSNQPVNQNALLETPFLSSVLRKASNGTYDKFGAFALKWQQKQVRHYEAVAEKSSI